MKFKILVPLMILVLAAGCATAKWQDREEAEKDGTVVKLQQRMEKGSNDDQGFSHPAEIDPGVLRAFFSDLEYTHERGVFFGPEQRSVFQPKEAERLASLAAEALEKADAGSRVHFTSFNYGKELLFKKKRMTRGVVFVDRDGSLNLAFSWINEPVDLEGNPERNGHGRRRDPLEIKSSSSMLNADRPYLSHAETQEGRSFPMWVTAEIEGLKQAAASADREPDQESESGDESVQESLEKPEHGPGEKRDEIRSRLKYLKELYEEGLITESEYESQKRQALEELQ